jgi:hypothetical protein
LMFDCSGYQKTIELCKKRYCGERFLLKIKRLFRTIG